jgi:hypothetical protein
MEDSKEFKPKRRERRTFSKDKGEERRPESNRKWQDRGPSSAKGQGDERRSEFKKKPWQDRGPTSLKDKVDELRSEGKGKWQGRSAAPVQREDRRSEFTKKPWQERRPSVAQDQGEERRKEFASNKPERRTDSAKPEGKQEHRIHYPLQNEPVELGYVAQKRITSIKNKLYEIRQYKRILEEQGLKPDQDDKVRESELIVQLLRLEKGLAPKARPQKLRDGSVPEGRRPEKAKRKLRRR